MTLKNQRIKKQAKRDKGKYSARKKATLQQVKMHRIVSFVNV
jgi:hypothetical protein